MAVCVCAIGGVENTTFEAKVKNFKKIRGQGPTFRGQTFSWPRTEMVKDQGHNFLKLWWVNFPKFLGVRLLMTLHFVKYLMIIRK